MTNTETYPVETLWVDTVSVVSVNADWDALGGEYREGFEVYEAPECPCGDYATWNSDEHAWRCTDADCENCGGDIEPDTEGPMMNYYYPLPDLRRIGGDPNEAASRISDLPLCLIGFGDGTYALALTGGGMDLSWEICEAFTRLGFLPPLHFADLPGMAGYPRDDCQLYVIRACIRSAEVAQGWAENTKARLLDKYGAEIG